jgi:hypothetical protein
MDWIDVVYMSVISECFLSKWNCMDGIFRAIKVLALEPQVRNVSFVETGSVGRMVSDFFGIK